MIKHTGIFGPGQCGKTFGCKALSRAHWTDDRRPSLVLDPNNEDWGPQALVFTDMSRFLPVVWKKRDCAVFIDEATMTIDRNTAFTDLFTRIRHRGHYLHVIGHRATVLQPVQRDQFSVLFLFRQSPGAAKIWAEEWADDRILQATTLVKYEFLLCNKFEGPGGTHLIKRGRFPAK
ncbi:hypothetical protein OpiT1DRAFT_04742 [Opitutaceae bacterium TAV1]|nr:hypothetical protein OpiT1DRAFT_04742 [Opitutaceae bacterium TAV1]